MGTVIERLEALNEAMRAHDAAVTGTPYGHEWATGSLVEGPLSADFDAEDIEYLGALYAVAPALLKLARAVAELPMNEPTNLMEWNQAVREFNALKAAYESLFREDPS